jgi:DNA-binding MarR family transcriptional regulator
LLIQLLELIYPEFSQKEIATLVFKDNASVTRIINLMVSKGYLIRSINEQNRRRFKLEISKLGAEVLHDLTPIVIRNRAEALKGVTEEELFQLEATLNKIIKNCI